MFETLKYLSGWVGPSGFGSKSTAEEVMQHYANIRSMTAIITGGTLGIGQETARVLAKHGVRLILPTRSYMAGEETKSRILDECPKAQVIIMRLDISSLSSVTNFILKFQSLHLPLNLLINNAGKFSHEHGISEDDFELTFATNYLGHFLLTKLLMKNMVETARLTGIEGRIINVSSNYHSNFTGDMISYLDLITKDKSQYNAARAYGLSKLANILHTKELAKRLNQMKANVTANCVHPGIARTRLFRGNHGITTFIIDTMFFLASRLLKTIPQAAATTCYVATNPSLEKVSGKYFIDCNEAFPSKLGANLYQAQKLWMASEKMTHKFCNQIPKNDYLLS